LTSLIGRPLGRYTVLEEIGRGGMARVYRARDNLLRRTVALKVLAPQLALDTEYIERFEREAIIAATLDHPNIVRIYDIYEYDGLRCIAMEFIEGRSLHAIISERGALGLAFAIAICGAVGAALDHAHQKSAVHRDIKPHNIMVSAEGRVMLTDFGIAQAPETRDGSRLTRTGFFMGTPEYISPEQASAQRVDGRSDLYSLAITAYEIITGKVPFVGATPQLMLAHLQTPPPSLSSFDPRQPPELDLVLARALAKSPDQRFQTAADFGQALRTVALTYQIEAALPSDLALLVRTTTSAGQGTISISREVTPPGQSTARPDPSSRAQPPGGRGPALGGAQYAAPQQGSTPRPRTPRPGTPTPRASEPYRETNRGSLRMSPQALLRDWRYAAPIGLVLVALFFLLLRAAFGEPAQLQSGVPVSSPLPAEPSATIRPTQTASPTPLPTNTSLPTATASPTEVATATLTPTLPPLQVPTPRPQPPAPTAEPPTAEPPTAEPPTVTAEPPTVTAEPPTATAEPPTATTAPYPPPNTPTALLITFTAVPTTPAPTTAVPTATATLAPTVVTTTPATTAATSVPPTDVPTAVPDTPTLTPTP
jgi:eukaryotic-like serine/threonine-protein kinase